MFEDLISEKKTKNASKYIRDMASDITDSKCFDCIKANECSNCATGVVTCNDYKWANI